MQNHNLGTLYCYEMKKIMKRKLVWATMFVCLVGVIVAVCSGLMGNYYVDGEFRDTHYHMYQVDRQYMEALSGRVVNQQLLTQMEEAYAMIPPGAERYTLTEEYQTYARPYSEIFNLVRTWTGMKMEEVKAWEADEQALYRMRQENLEKEWQDAMLTEKEKAFWREKEAQINKPVTYLYYDGLGRCAVHFVPTIGVLMLLFVAVSLSGIFAEEHTRRTDQLILTGAKGKSTAYYAKILAGISFAALGTLVMETLTVILALSLYGAGGFEAVFQLAYAGYSYPLTVGQACLIEYGIILVTAVTGGVFVMVLSEVLHNSLATLAVCSGWIIAGMMIHIPEQSRVLCQIWNWQPSNFLAVRNIFDERMIPLFGRCLVSWQIVPALYLFFALLAVAWGIRVYRRYQVSGR